PQNWVVTPVPEYGRRHGDGSPYNTATGPPPPGDPAFDKSGGFGSGGSFGAGYHVWGNLFPVLSTSPPYHATADASANFAVNATIFGSNLEVARLESGVHIDSGEITLNGFNSPGASAYMRCYLMGSQLPGSADPVDISSGNFNLNCHDFHE